MKDREYMLQLISLFKEGKITQFSLEQEMALYLGGDCEVRIHNDPHATTTSSFGIFPLPRLHVSGLSVIFYIDKCALDNFYTPEELLNKLVLISDAKQSYMRSFFKFVTEKRHSDVSFCDALGCLLKIYQSVAQYLRVEGKDFIPDDNTLLGIISDCEEGVYVDENIEKLFIANIVPSEAVEAAKEMSHASDAEITIKFSDDEKPTSNIFTQERRTFCDGTYDYLHRDIPYDYKPSTNQ